MLAIMGLEFITTNMGLLDLSPLVVTIIGLCVGEITKFLNVNLPEIRKMKSPNKPAEPNQPTQ